MTKLVLVADDDVAIRTVLNQALGRAGYAVRACSNAATLWRWVQEGEGDLVITDVIMPDESGFDLLPRIKRIRPGLPVIVMSAQNTVLTAITAAERGAFEYLPKPFDLSELISIASRAIASAEGPPQARTAPEEGEPLPLIGRSPAMQEVYRVMARLMGNDLTVLITGESGTGKELVARALHDYGKRKRRPFVALNMAAIPRELIESELFGHERGSFTGASARTIGRFEQAEGGTLFLDEIGDMPMEAQTRLLRVLQDGEYSPVGSRAAVKANVRIVAATNRDLSQSVRQGLFREDLYYRINVVPIRMPPLRDRLEDVPDLVRHFLTQAAGAGLPSRSVTADALELLRHHRWPGNVRELENMVRRLVVLTAADQIGADEVRQEFVGAALAEPGQDGDMALSVLVERHVAKLLQALPPGSLPDPGLHDRVLAEVEKPLIAAILTACRGNQIKAAKVLGLNRNTLRKRIKDLDIRLVRSAW
jgi:two-component system, NtrC family, nitrogen regulation response regulator GlnG